MRLASQWLTLERVPIEEAAQRFSYTSQTTFSRTFKRITGKTLGFSQRLKQSAAT
jgi:AraC-like DNA-binding protein